MNSLRPWVIRIRFLYFPMHQTLSNPSRPKTSRATTLDDLRLTNHMPFVRGSVCRVQN